jgi:Fur family zinc uptake transcriptional regulator
MKALQVFPAPDHDHGRCASDAMMLAETICHRHGQRLTPTRRQVLMVLLSSHRPLGAYEILERLAPRRPQPAPITVYRALEFLRGNGLVHRIESQNAFFACVHNHGNPGAADFMVFLICETCGAVGEVASAEVAQSLRTAARAAGFTPKSPVIEITGICTHCAHA